jgi:hypothetical protein
VHVRPGTSRVSPVTGDDATRQQGIETLVAQRLEWYASPGGQDHVPNPRRPLAVDGAVPRRTGAAVGWVGHGAALLYLAFLSEAGDGGLSGLAALAFVLGLLAAPLLVWRARRRSGQVALWTELARPWLDVLDGLRLGSVEPANPARGIALSHVGRVQRLLRPEARRWDSRALPTDAVRDEVQQAGALTWATSEAWRRRQAGLRLTGGVSPLDRLPAVVGPTAEEASTASDASADAATAALGAGEYDLDFVDLARRRAAMYARAEGPDATVPDPSEPLLVGASALERRRRRVVVGSAVVLVGMVVSWGLLVAGHPGWSALAAVPTAAVWFRARSLSWRDVWPRTVAMPPGPAMAWRDYLDAVDHADSGLAPVTTVEAIRGSEERVRAILVELGRASATEQPVLAAELHRLCSGAWTLVGQERAEARLLDQLDDRPWTDRG